MTQLERELEEAKEEYTRICNDPQHPRWGHPNHDIHMKAVRDMLELRDFIETHDPGWVRADREDQIDAPTFSELREPPDPGSVVALRRMQRERAEEKKQDDDRRRFRHALEGHPLPEEEPGRES